MFQQLLRFDVNWFQKINKDWSSPWLDVLMPILTDLHRYLPFWIFVIVLSAILAYQERMRFVRILLAVFFSVALSDVICHHVLKEAFKRPRPEFSLQEPILRTHSHSGYSLPSNHAANIMAAASTLGFFFPHVRFLFMLVAAVIGFSRIYVGVHFPLDVLSGYIFGLCCSLTVWLAFSQIEDWLAMKKRIQDIHDTNPEVILAERKRQRMPPRKTPPPS